MVQRVPGGLYRLPGIVGQSVLPPAWRAERWAAPHAPVPRLAGPVAGTFNAAQSRVCR